MPAAWCNPEGGQSRRRFLHQPHVLAKKPQKLLLAEFQVTVRKCEPFVLSHPTHPRGCPHPALAQGPHFIPRLPLNTCSRKQPRLQGCVCWARRCHTGVVAMGNISVCQNSNPAQPTEASHRLPCGAPAAPRSSSGTAPVGPRGGCARAGEGQAGSGEQRRQESGRRRTERSRGRAARRRKVPAQPRVPLLRDTESAAAAQARAGLGAAQFPSPGANCAHQRRG